MHISSPQTRPRFAGKQTTPIPGVAGQAKSLKAHHSQDQVQIKFAGKQEDLVEAAGRGDMQAIKNLVKEGADVHKSSDNNKHTPMTMAAAYGRWQIMEKLNEEHLVSFTKSDANGNTPMTAAVVSGQWKILEKLISNKNVNINHKNSSGDTALEIAIRKGQIPAIQLLLRNGVDIEKADRFGFPPLYQSTISGQSEIAKQLIEYGANINTQVKAGITPLSTAAKDGKIKIMQVLLESGADVEIANDWGKTPLLYAAANKQAEALKLLIKYGANIHAQNEYGKTAFSLSGKEYKEIKDILVNAHRYRSSSLADTMSASHRICSVKDNQHENDQSLSSKGKMKSSISQSLSTPTKKLFDLVKAGATQKEIEATIDGGANILGKDEFGKMINEYATTQDIKRFFEARIEQEKFWESQSTKDSLSQRSVAPERPGVDASIFSNDSMSERSVAPERPGLDASIFSRNSVSDRRSVLTERPARQAASSSSAPSSASRISTADRATAERVFTLLNSHFLFEPAAQGIASQLNGDVARHLAQLFQARGVAEEDVFQLSSDQRRASHGHPDICRFWRDFDQSYPWQNH